MLLWKISIKTGSNSKTRGKTRHTYWLFIEAVCFGVHAGSRKKAVKFHLHQNFRKGRFKVFDAYLKSLIFANLYANFTYRPDHFAFLVAELENDKIGIVMKSIYLYFVFVILLSTELIYAQELIIRQIDESDYPFITIQVEFTSQEEIDFEKVKILELNDTIGFTIDSLPNFDQSKAVCILISSFFLDEPQKVNYVNEFVNKITKAMKVGDLLNILITRNGKNGNTCIYPVSSDFSKDYQSIAQNLRHYGQAKEYPGLVPFKACSVEGAIDYISAKNNLPPKKMLLVMAQDLNLTEELKQMLNEKSSNFGIHLNWLRTANTITAGNENLPQLSADLSLQIDTLFSTKPNQIFKCDKTFQLTFRTKQTASLNQFELRYKTQRLRSTFTGPVDQGFYTQNPSLIIIFVLFFLVVVYLAYNQIKVKRMLSNILIRQTSLPEPDKTNGQNTENSPPRIADPYLIIENEGQLSRFNLTKTIHTIGRSEENDAVIDNLTISGKHSTISLENGVYFIQDNLSTNGTIVNDLKISKIAIKNGDIIRLGKVRVIVYI
jgi:hypothetical protein